MEAERYSKNYNLTFPLIHFDKKKKLPRASFKWLIIELIVFITAEIIVWFYTHKLDLVIDPVFCVEIIFLILILVTIYRITKRFITEGKITFSADRLIVQRDGYNNIYYLNKMQNIKTNIFYLSNQSPDVYPPYNIEFEYDIVHHKYEISLNNISQGLLLQRRLNEWSNEYKIDKPS